MKNYVGPLPLIRRADLRYYVVARPRARPIGDATCSIVVVVPCRNEKGNIEPLVKALPDLPQLTEILLIEGQSRDGTHEECVQVQKTYPDRPIVVARQYGVGKADAVRKGFGTARGGILLILDADRTGAPEEMPKFYDVLASGKAEFVTARDLPTRCSRVPCDPQLLGQPGVRRRAVVAGRPAIYPSKPIGPISANSIHSATSISSSGPRNSLSKSGKSRSAI